MATHKRKPPMPKKKKSRSNKPFYLALAFILATLLGTGFFRQWGAAQRLAFQTHFGHPVGLFMGEPDLGEATGSLQNFVLEIMTGLNLNRMFSLVEEGLGLSGIVQTWGPADPMDATEFRFVRRQNLVHDPTALGNPAPRASNGLESDYLVYLFNSHTEERFGDNQTTVMDITAAMKEVFLANGIPTLKEDRVTHLWMNENWGYFQFARSYQATRVFIEERIHQFPSLMFFFDIHRDAGISDPWHTVDGLDLARVQLIISPDNTYHRYNLAVAYEIAQMLEERQPGIMRNQPVRVQRGGDMVMAYNQDISPFLKLFEIGDNHTPVQAAFNSARILAEVLSEFIWQQDLVHEN